MDLIETRAQSLTRASGSETDLVVIGGGIAGACAAWDGALRGLNVVLFERNDFGGATSAHGLKILHGGIRYLQHMDFPRLRESCRERGAFLRIAPHLTSPLPFVVPTYGHGLRGKEAFRVAFALLSILTYGRNKGIPDPSQRIPIGRMLTRVETLQRFPDLPRENLTGAAMFYDGLILNPPRLVFSILRSAISEGANACNYCEVEKILTSSADDAVTGVVVRDKLTGQELEIATKAIVNAAGPYAPFVGGLKEPAAPRTPFSRDMAFVIDRVSDDDAALAVQTRYKDPDAIISRGNRHLFMVPWRDYTLIGVNSTVFSDHPDRLEISEEEIADFIEEINEARPSLALSRDDVWVVNAGLLPFGNNESTAKDLSFGKRSLVTDHGRNGGRRGLVSAMSVRWTMGRAAAQEAIDYAQETVQGQRKPCLTAHRRIHGGDFKSWPDLVIEIRTESRLQHLSDKQIERLAVNHGSAWTDILDLVTEDSSLGQEIDGTTTLQAEVVHAVRNEMAVYLEDVVLRRTEMGSGTAPSQEALRACCTLISRELGWTLTRQEEEVRRVESLYPFYNPPQSARARQSRTNPKTVKILCPTYWYPEHSDDVFATYVHDINRHLVRLGHQVRVVTPASENQSLRAEFDGVEVVRFPLSLPEDLTYGKVAQSRIEVGAKLKRLRTMAVYLKRQFGSTIREGRDFNPDLVHGHWAIPTGPALVSAAQRLHLKSIITLHGGDVYVNKDQGYDFPTRWYVRPILKWTLQHADGLTAISEDCRKHALQAGAPDEQIKIIMNGADLRRFSPGSAEYPEYGDQMIFACRQLFPRKGIRFLILAAAALRKEFPQLQVVVAGDGFERESLQDLARDLGISDCVSLLGWVPNAQLPGYYRSAAFSVIPSLEEGFGVPAAEAMGCGLPVIASDAGGLPEVVADGVTGLVVRKGDVEALTLAMRRLLGDRGIRQRFGEAGRKRALERFDWLITAKSMERMYRDLLNP